MGTNGGCRCDERALRRGAMQLRAHVADLERTAQAAEDMRDAYAARVRELERERDAALARVRELEAALREIVAIDSASPEHRIAMRALGDSPAVSTLRLRRGDVVRVKGSALVEIRHRLGEVLDVNGGEVLVNVATAQGPQRHWLFVEQVEKT